MLTVVMNLLNSRKRGGKVKNYRQQLDALGLHHLEVRIASLTRNLEGQDYIKDILGADFL